MQGPEDPRREPADRPKEHSSAHAERPSGLVDACTIAVMLAVAVGAVAIECGFYKAFDDNQFDLDRSAWPAMLALLGLGSPQENAPAPQHARGRAG